MVARAGPRASPRRRPRSRARYASSGDLRVDDDVLPAREAHDQVRPQPALVARSRSSARRSRSARACRPSRPRGGAASRPSGRARPARAGRCTRLRGLRAKLLLALGQRAHLRGRARRRPRCALASRAPGSAPSTFSSDSRIGFTRFVSASRLISSRRRASASMRASDSCTVCAESDRNVVSRSGCELELRAQRGHTRARVAPGDERAEESTCQCDENVGHGSTNATQVVGRPRSAVERSHARASEGRMRPGRAGHLRPCRHDRAARRANRRSRRAGREARRLPRGVRPRLPVVGVGQGARRLVGSAGEGRIRAPRPRVGRDSRATRPTAWERPRARAACISSSA